MKGRDKLERAWKPHRPPPPRRWIPPRVERAQEFLSQLSYLSFVVGCWTGGDEDEVIDADYREGTRLLSLMTAQLRFVEWPEDTDDLYEGPPLWERRVAKEKASKEIAEMCNPVR